MPKDDTQTVILTLGADNKIAKISVKPRGPITVTPPKGITVTDPSWDRFKIRVQDANRIFCNITALSFKVSTTKDVTFSDSPYSVTGLKTTTVTVSDTGADPRKPFRYLISYELPPDGGPGGNDNGQIENQT